MKYQLERVSTMVGSSGLYRGTTLRQAQGRLSVVSWAAVQDHGFSHCEQGLKPSANGEPRSARLKPCPDKNRFLKHALTTWVALLVLSVPLFGQLVSSHAPSGAVKPVSTTPAPQASGKPVARVNGVVLTDNDLLREMYTIFPYARQHNGKFPQELEPSIRQGALKMIVFEELVYQEALRRGMTVSQAKLDKAVADFRKQFKNPDDYRNFVKTEGGGSRAGAAGQDPEVAAD